MGLPPWIQKQDHILGLQTTNFEMDTRIDINLSGLNLAHHTAHSAHNHSTIIPVIHTPYTG